MPKLEKVAAGGGQRCKPQPARYERKRSLVLPIMASLTGLTGYLP